MKTILMFLLIISGGFSAPVRKELTKKQAPHSNYISIADAEKILGQPARLADSSKEEKEQVIRYNCTYTALANDPKTNAKGNLYYLLAQYKNVAAAQKAYAAILNSNRGMQGQETLTNIGDEAFFHTDNEHFCLIIFRKQNRIVSMKVNRITSTTSQKELRRIAGDISKN
jgi:hypothetical protein